MIEDSLDALFVALERVDAQPYEYVLFGSAVLYLHDIRDGDTVGDIDVFVSRRVWGALMAVDGAHVLTPRAGDPPLLEFRTSPPLHLFYEWTSRDAEWITYHECWASAEAVRGWQCASLAEIRRHKAKSFEMNSDSPLHQKHARDVELIDLRLAAS